MDGKGGATGAGVGSYRKARLAAAGAAVVGLVSAALAQDSAAITPVRRFDLTFGQRFAVQKNPRLTVGNHDTVFRSTTSLGFHATVEDEFSQLDFHASTALNLEDPSSKNKKPVTPQLLLHYARTGANSDLKLDANYSYAPIRFIHPLTDFVDANGQITLPDDLGQLYGTGDRIAYGAGIGLTLRKNDPLSLTFNAATRQREYRNTDNPSLFNNSTDTFGVVTNMRFEEGFVGHLNYNWSHYTADNTNQTRRQRQNVSFGIDRALSPVLDLSARIGYSWINTRELSGDTTTNKLNGGVDLTLSLPNGKVLLSFSSTTEPNGNRQTLNLGRDFDLPTGTLSVGAGATRSPTDHVSGTGYVKWTEDLPTSTVQLAVVHGAQYVESLDTDQVFTTATASYHYDINQTSWLSLRGAFTNRDQQNRLSLDFSYNHLLTEDWSLNTGVGYNQRQDNGYADGATIYVGINRDFTLPF